jgi:hypothetical protein
MDWVVRKIVSFGVPGLVLLITMGISGFAGAAAITWALAALGGPFGMLGGIAALGLLALIADSISKYGFSSLLKESVRQMEGQGLTREEIVKRIRCYPISSELKAKVIVKIESIGNTCSRLTTQPSASWTISEVRCSKCGELNSRSSMFCVFCGGLLRAGHTSSQSSRSAVVHREAARSYQADPGEGVTRERQ